MRINPAKIRWKRPAQVKELTDFVSAQKLATIPGTEGAQVEADMLLDLELIQAHSAAGPNSKSTSANNRDFIRNFGKRYRPGETISTVFVESTINQVVSTTLHQKATNAVDAEERTPIVASQNEGVE